MSEQNQSHPSPWPTTQWTLLSLMADSGSESPPEAQVGAFLADYMAPLKAYLVKRRRLKTQDAEDVLQEFILQRFLSHDLARHVDQSRGKFRTFLLTSLDNFLRNQQRYNQAQRRSPEHGLIALHDEAQAVKGDHPSADNLFEVEWARMVIRQAVAGVKQHCDQTARPNIWLAFEARVISPILDDISPTSNEELAQRLGMDSPQQVANAVVTAKRIYQRALRSVIEQYARDKQEVEAELTDLRAILSRASR